MALPIFWTQKGLEDTHLLPQFQGATSMRGPDPHQMFFPLLQVKCRKPFNGESLGFPNSRVNLFNLWFYSQRKNFHLNVLMVSILQTEALQFRLSSGNSRKGKKRNSAYEINAKSWHLHFFLLLFILLMRMLWWKCFSQAPKWCKRNVYWESLNFWRQLLASKPLVLIWLRECESETLRSGQQEPLCLWATSYSSNLPVSCAAEAADWLEGEFVCRTGDGWVD